MQGKIASSYRIVPAGKDSSVERLHLLINVQPLPFPAPDKILHAKMEQAKQKDESIV